MKAFSRYWAVLMICFIVSCRNAWDRPFTETKMVHLKPSITLSSEGVPSILQKTVKSIGMVDTLLVVVDEFQAPFFNFYSTHTLLPVGKYGRRGDGRTDFVNPKYDNQFSIENNETFMYVNDAQHFILSKISVTKALADTNYVHSYTRALPPSLILSYVSLFLTKDSLLVGNYRGTGSQEKEKGGRFFIYDLITSKMHWIKYFPKVNEKPTGSQIPYYYYSFCAFNPEKQVMSSFMHNFDRIDFIDFNNRKNYSSVFSGDSFTPPPASVGTKPTAETITYTQTSFGGKNYVYSFATGLPLKMRNASGNYLRLVVTDWQGKEVATAWLDRNKLSSFTVDERNRKLYAVNWEDDHERKPVIVYDLTPLNLTK